MLDKLSKLSNPNFSKTKPWMKQNLTLTCSFYKLLLYLQFQCSLSIFFFAAIWLPFDLTIDNRIASYI